MRYRKHVCLQYVCDISQTGEAEAGKFKVSLGYRTKVTLQRLNKISHVLYITKLCYNYSHVLLPPKLSPKKDVRRGPNESDLV